MPRPLGSGYFTERTSITFDKDTLRGLKEAALEKGMPISMLVRIIIGDWLKAA